MRPILPIATKGFLAHFRARSSIRVSRAASGRGWVAMEEEEEEEVAQGG